MSLPTLGPEPDEDSPQMEPGDVEGVTPADYAEYARLRAIATARTAEAKSAKDAADAMEERLLNALIDSGQPSFTVGEKLVYMQTKVAANKKPEVTSEAFHQALRDADLAEFITPSVSAARLAAYARELLDNDDELPDGVAAVLNVHQMTELRIKAAKTKSRRTPVRRS